MRPARCVRHWLRSAALAAAAAVLPGAAGGCADPVDERPASFAYLHAAILAPSCATAGCHSALSATFDVDLEDRDDAYEALVGRGFAYPFEPERSRLLYLLRAEEVRKPMPPDQPLPDADIDLVERWIADGAEDD